MPPRIAWTVCVGDGRAKKIDEGRMSISTQRTQVNVMLLSLNFFSQSLLRTAHKKQLAGGRAVASNIRNSASSTTVHRSLMAEMERHPRAP